MTNPTENATSWARAVSPRKTIQHRGRLLLLAGVTGVVLLGGGAGLAYAGQTEAPPGSTGYGTVVDERGAALPNWPNQTAADPSTSTAEDCPTSGDGSDGGDDGAGSASPSQPTNPTIPDGEL